MLRTYFYEENLTIVCKENGGSVRYDYQFFKEGFEEWAAELKIKIADIDDLIRYVTECGYNVIDVYYEEEE